MVEDISVSNFVSSGLFDFSVAVVNAGVIAVTLLMVVCTVVLPPWASVVTLVDSEIGILSEPGAVPMLSMAFVVPPWTAVVEATSRDEGDLSDVGTLLTLTRTTSVPLSVTVSATVDTELGLMLPVEV